MCALRSSPSCPTRGGRACVCNWPSLFTAYVPHREFPGKEHPISLQVLYLHGNCIRKLSDVAKLAQLPRLAKLTLHGNPICEAPAYRMFVPAHVPLLKSLDFGPFTKVERDTIASWKRGHDKRLAAH